MKVKIDKKASLLHETILSIETPSTKVEKITLADIEHELDFLTKQIPSFAVELQAAEDRMKYLLDLKEKAYKLLK